MKGSCSIWMKKQHHFANLTNILMYWCRSKIQPHGNESIKSIDPATQQQAVIPGMFNNMFNNMSGGKWWLWWIDCAYACVRKLDTVVSFLISPPQQYPKLLNWQVSVVTQPPSCDVVRLKKLYRHVQKYYTLKLDFHRLTNLCLCEKLFRERELKRNQIFFFFLERWKNI